MAVGNVVEVEDLSFAYGGGTGRQKALDCINLIIEKGRFVMITGPSGAGKSTLACCLNGLIPHFIKGEYRGNVSVMGKNIAAHTVGAISRDMGLVFQDFEAQLFSTNTSLELVFGPENFNMPRPAMQQILRQTLKLVRLEGLEDRPPHTLSGGQKQRLAIGSVLAMQPQIICMDEPTTDLDPACKRSIFNLAGEIHRDEALTLVVFEHHTEDALLAERLIVMDQGKIVRDGEPAEILRNVALFEALGLAPLQVPAYFHKLGLSREQLPLTPEAGVQRFRELQLSFDPQKYDTLLANDRQREKGYGDVIISLKGAHYEYENGTEALKGMDLEIREGEFLAIVGANGSGKTTLAKLLNGLLLPTRGQVQVRGKDTRKARLHETGQSVGYVFQNPDHQIFADTVYDEVAFSPKIRGCTDEETAERVQQALQAVKLDGYEKEDPFSLSRGERQRVAVASVLSARPRVIILDEPTTGLDNREQHSMLELLKTINKDGHTIIMVTHGMRIVAEYAHRMGVLQGGRLLTYGQTREVFNRKEALLQASLQPPHIVSMSSSLGKTILSVAELLYCSEKREGSEGTAHVFIPG